MLASNLKSLCGKLGRDCRCRIGTPFRAVHGAQGHSSGKADWKDQAREISEDSKDALSTWTMGPSYFTMVKTLADVMTGQVRLN